MSTTNEQPQPMLQITISVDQREAEPLIPVMPTSRRQSSKLPVKTDSFLTTTNSIEAPFARRESQLFPSSPIKSYFAVENLKGNEKTTEEQFKAFLDEIDKFQISRSQFFDIDELDLFVYRNNLADAEIIIKQNYKASMDFSKESLKYVGKLARYANFILENHKQQANQIERLTNETVSLKVYAQKYEQIKKKMEELDVVLEAEVKKRSTYEKELERVKQSFEKLQTRYKESRKKQTKDKELNAVPEPKTVDYEGMLKERDEQIDQLLEQMQIFECEVEEWKVIGIKAQRKCEDIEKQRNQLIQDVTDSSISEKALAEKVDIISKRLRETQDKLQQYTDIYQATKKDDEQRKTEIEDLSSKLEQAVKQNEALTRQRKQLQTEFSATVKQKQDLFEKCRNLEALIEKRKKEAEDLKTKITDTIKDYESKLERCEERIYSLSEKVNELEASKKTRAVGIDPTLILEMENKLKARDEQYQNEIEHVAIQLKEKERELAEAQKIANDLKEQQFNPRMQKLKLIESEMKTKIEEYALAEECLETQLLCPRCTDIIKSPVTVIPCGHSFCKDCLSLIQEENYGDLTCGECQKKCTGMFKNERTDAFLEQFEKRRQLTKSFLVWIYNLKMPE